MVKRTEKQKENGTENIKDLKNNVSEIRKRISI